MKNIKEILIVNVMKEQHIEKDLATEIVNAILNNDSFVEEIVDFIIDNLVDDAMLNLMGIS
jgi:hypothetical protein